MRAANYYLQHLDCKLAVILLSDAAVTQQSPSTANTTRPRSDIPYTAQQVQTNSHKGPQNLSALDDGMGDDELDSLLQEGLTDDFNLGSLQEHDTQNEEGIQVCTTSPC